MAVAQPAEDRDHDFTQGISEDESFEENVVYVLITSNSDISDNGETVENLNSYSDESTETEIRDTEESNEEDDDEVIKYNNGQV